MDRLSRLAIKYRTDKVPQLGHSYTPYYHKLLKNRIIKKVLEIGVGYPETMQHVPGYVTGASLFMWRDYFPGARIYAIENNEKAIINEDRIKTFLADQSSPEDLEKVIKEIGDVDMIIDDGSHKTEHQIISAKYLIAHTKLYIIEDVSEPDKIRLELDYEWKEKAFLRCNDRDDRLMICQLPLA